MSEYHKIQSIYKRDPDNNYKTFLEGEYSLPEFKMLKDIDWVFTEKVDGTNIRVTFEPLSRPHIVPSIVTFRGRTDRADIPPFLLKYLEETFTRDENEYHDKFPKGFVLYGEGYGAKIQKGGGNYRQDQAFVLFDVMIDGHWLDRGGVFDVADFLGIESVPLRGMGTLDDMVSFIKEGDTTSLWGDFEMEGLVARPRIELKTRSGHRIITKVKCRDFPKE